MSRHHRTHLLLIVVAFALVPLTGQVQNVYYPEPGDAWKRRPPEEVGMNPQELAAAIEYARAHESGDPRDLELSHYMSFGTQPFGDAVGPFKNRGDMTGVIVRNGYLVAEWGAPERVDMTFSVTKSFLSTTVGLALDHGLIEDHYHQHFRLSAWPCAAEPQPLHSPEHDLQPLYEGFDRPRLAAHRGERV